MKVTSHDFKNSARAALQNKELAAALNNTERGFVDTRRERIAELRNFAEIRSSGKAIKDHVIANLDHYLIAFEEQVAQRGGHVHWATNAQQANEIVAQICREAKAQKILKGKSMVSEEMGLNDHLAEQGMDVVETDLGEYIIQLAGEAPSHIIAPAIHKQKHEVSALFDQHHGAEYSTKRGDDREDLVAEAREVLRDKFLNADVGITGANFLIAETGGVVLVTNEGNGDLSAALPDVHIVTTGIEKIIPRMSDLGTMLRLLPRSSTGQEMSVYTTLFNGPKKGDGRQLGDGERRKALHIVLLDNGRSDLVDDEFADILRCIRCGACLNHCPVYTSIGGHAYGWVYPGPMGSVLTPILVGRPNAKDLPNACTMNGRCASVCPMSIPLPDLLRRHRQRLHDAAEVNWLNRLLNTLWFWLTKNPSVYGWQTRGISKLLRALAGSKGKLSRFPGMSAWSASRHLIVPQQTTFQARWKQQRRSQSDRSANHES